MNTKPTGSPALWILFLLAGFGQLSETIYSPALPEIAIYLHASSSWVQWTLSLYFIGFSLGVFFWGRLSDHTGRKPAMLLGLSLYTLSSFLCLLSKNIEWLLFARLLQGLGASAGSVVTMTIARESLQDHTRARFFAAAGFAIAAAIALGPFIGGYLTHWFNWHANFIFLTVLGIILMVMIVSSLPETHDQTKHQKVKLFTVFKALLNDKHALLCTWLVGTVNGFLFSYFAESPFIFIHLVKINVAQDGLLSIAVAVAALLGSITSRKLLGKVTISTLILIGALLMLLGSLLLMLVGFTGWINVSHQLLSVILIMLPIMIIIYGGFGFVVPMTLSSALQKHKAVLGTAGAIFGLGYYLLVTVFTWVMGLIHNGSILPMPIYFFVLSLSSVVAAYSIRKNL